MISPEICKMCTDFPPPPLPIQKGRGDIEAEIVRYLRTHNATCARCAEIYYNTSGQLNSLPPSQTSFVANQIEALKVVASQFVGISSSSGRVTADCKVHSIFTISMMAIYNRCFKIL